MIYATKNHRVAEELSLREIGALTLFFREHLNFGRRHALDRTRSGPRWAPSPPPGPGPGRACVEALLEESGSGRTRRRVGKPGPVRAGPR